VLQNLEQKNFQQLDVNMIFLYHCFRDHVVMRSNKYEKVKDLPAITYKAPSFCINCRDENVNEKNVRRYLPSIEDGLLCKCRFISCEEEFFALPSWVLFYPTEKHFPELQPVLIEKDAAKIKKLIPDWQKYGFLIDYLKSLESEQKATV